MNLKSIVTVAMSGTVGKILRPIVAAVSAPIRHEMVEFWVKIRDHALTTEGEADDAMVAGLKELFGITDAEILQAETD
jgi:hypothetical protein